MRGASTELGLSVVVPVYNQAGSILESVKTIQERIGGALGEPFEIIVVSDGSVDRTDERLLESRSSQLRVIHYDRNLGKGYAVKIGALTARGLWISYIDADLDLDPSSIPAFLAVARKDSLDFAIGSKRHPDSIVHYPPARRAASWLYQQLVRVLFRLNVRDTQVGLKVFRREIAEQVMPLLLVKRYAFDLELLAVAGGLGFDRIGELPIRLDYRFSGSGVGSIAVLRALVDTLAIFYRLRILRYYARRRQLILEGSYSRAPDYAPLVTVIGGDGRVADRLDYGRVEVIEGLADDASDRLAAARRAQGTLLAFLEEDAVPAGNWLSGAVQFLRHPDIAAVVTPSMAPNSGTFRARAAAAVWESRLSGGWQHFRFTPGNIRFVRDFPGESVIVKREDFLAVARGGDSAGSLCERLDALGKRVLYTPETVVIVPRPGLLLPHLRAVWRQAAEHAQVARRRPPAAFSLSVLPAVAVIPLLGLAAALLTQGGDWRRAGIFMLLAYGAVVVASGAVAALRFRSARVGALAAGVFPLTHLAYSAGFLAELVRRR